MIESKALATKIAEILDKKGATASRRDEAHFR